MENGYAFKAIARNDWQRLLNCCELSVRGKYDLEEVDYYGNTPLLKACHLGSFEAVRMLLRYRSNIKAINYFGQNALTLATYSGSVETVSYLLRIRSFHDFNLSSVIPAYCVAILRRHQELIHLFWNLDKQECWTIKTSHGLRGSDIQEMLERLSAKGLM